MTMMKKNNKDEKPSHSTFTYLVLVGRDVKEPAPLFEKSRGRKLRWCGQLFLGWVGYPQGEILI